MVAYRKPQQRKKEGSERLTGDREIRSSLLIVDLKMAGRKMQESKKVRRSITCTFLE